MNEFINNNQNEIKSENDFIPENEYKIEGVRSSGKGGQNVNKTSSKAKLTLNIDNCSIFSDEEKERIKKFFGKKVSKEGNIILSSQDQRDFDQNKNDVIGKLNKKIHQALFVPKERIPTNPTRSSKERRIDDKKKEGRKKDLRRKIEEW